MTRLAVLADIHGNLPALDAVLRDLENYPVDQVVLAGDFIGRGPFSLEVLHRVADGRYPLIRGNHELYVLDHGTPRAPEAWRNHTMTPWMQNQIGTRWIGRMAYWPDTLCLRFPDAPPLRIFHGTPHSAYSGIFDSDSDAKLRKMLDGVLEDTIIVAHTHLPFDRVVDRWHILNPGSIGLPLDGVHSASYMILDGDADGWRATFHRVPFDYDALYSEFARLNLVGAWGVTGRIVLREFETARPHFTSCIRWHDANHPGVPWSDELFEEYLRVNHWNYLPITYHVNVGQERYELDDLELQRATVEDMTSVNDILNEAAQWMTDRGIRQWQVGSFTVNRIADSIRRGEVYLARQNDLAVGTLTVQWHDPEVWGERPNDAVYVHKLAVRRAAAGQGLGVRLLRWAEQLAAEAGKSFVRLDCQGTNMPLRRFYAQAGFTECGYVETEHWSAQLFERKVGATN